MKISKVLSMVFLMSSVLFISAEISAKERKTGRGNPDGPVVFVLSQGLYYDSIVLTDLPMKGNFQQLIPNMDGSLHTDYGPGEVGHLGGRWWVDANPNGVMDEDDAYFLCPLLGPGREEF
ncbi:MAG: hypothetical protein ACKE9I_00285 [Methylophagaceae bacterium]